MKHFFFFILIAVGFASNAQAIKVELSSNNGNWELLRNGSPYYIKGAGGDKQLDKLVEIGGNSIRTWSTDNARQVLDDAQKHGLTVMMGLWVQHERHGFDYDDEVKVKAQLDGFRRVVLELKDHPALLFWGIGNEVDLNYSNTHVWDAIEDIAKMIHTLDPNHPTSTVTAGLDKDEVALIKAKAPNIDIYGINTYGDLGNIKKNIREFGWTGPYIISEWGPNGHWEVAKTSWNVPIEQSSNEKAEMYFNRYKDFIIGDREMCIGSYVFLWGQKQETTSTWYGLFSESGLTSEAIDRLELLWTGKEPRNRAPLLKSVQFNGKTKFEKIEVTADQRCEAYALVNDLDGDKLKFDWLIIPESTDIRSGGDAESAPLPVQGLFSQKRTESSVFRAPLEAGSYRLFVFVMDGKGHYSYENIPFYVNNASPDAIPSRAVSFKRLEMIP